MRQAHELLTQILGQGASPPAAEQQASSQQRQTGSFDLGSLLSGPGGLATGALAGGLAGLLLSGKKPEKIAKSALQLGGAAIVGGLAYTAWRNWKSNAPVPREPAQSAQLTAPPPGTPFLPADQEARDELSTMLIRAMIHAAKADGHITPVEREKISRQLESLSLATEHRQFIEAELAKPLDIEAVVAPVQGPEQAAEVYAASLLAIDPAGRTERAYLQMLAARLELDPELVAHLHANAGWSEFKQAA